MKFAAPRVVPLTLGGSAMRAPSKSRKTQLDQPAPRYATVAEAADYGSMNPHTIRRMIDGGTLTRYGYGTRILRVDLNELDAILRGGK